MISGKPFGDPIISIDWVWLPLREVPSSLVKL